jgi:hypothetical protein
VSYPSPKANLVKWFRKVPKLFGSFQLLGQNEFYTHRPEFTSVAIYDNKDSDDIWECCMIFSNQQAMDEYTSLLVQGKYCTAVRGHDCFRRIIFCSLRDQIINDTTTFLKSIAAGIDFAVCQDSKYSLITPMHRTCTDILISVACIIRSGVV